MIDESELPKPLAAIISKPTLPDAAYSQTLSRKIPLTRWNEFHIWPTTAGLRHLVFYSKQNGFDKVIRRCGRRILLDEKSFFEWLDNKGDHHG